MFDVRDAAAVMSDVRAARNEHVGEYIKLNAYDARLGRQTTALSFIIGRPEQEAGFHLERSEANDRVVRYQLQRSAPVER